MFLVKVVFICVYFTNAFGFFSFQNSYRVLLLKDLNFTTTKIQVNERTIEQPLDHFNENEKRTWNMRYFEGLELWKEGGPVYLLIGGESSADPHFLQTGITYELARETNGALYMSEHRYYGKSQPFSEMNTENLAYLSARQALADIAYLLKAIKSLPQFSTSKVVVVGGSYPGNLATWMRLLYPNLVDAAIASSAPVLAKVDFLEYLETVGITYYKYGSSECYNKIVAKFNRYDQLFQTRIGIEQLKQEENICQTTNMSKPENKQTFFLLNVMKFSTQYAHPKDIKKDCSYIENVEFDSEHERSAEDCYKKFGVDFWNEECACNNFSFDALVNAFKRTPWIYQTCTEFGYYPTANSEKQPFTKNIPLEMLISICSNGYGADFNKFKVQQGVKNTNDMYGGLTPNVSQVVFVNGDLDPWHRLSVLKDLSKNAPARLVRGSSHCQDLVSDTPEDPEELIETRKYVKQLIKKWIGAAKH